MLFFELFTSYIFVSGTNGLNDSLIASSGMAFSTNDRDNDVADTTNCADIYKGGWWYIACIHATLNGEYFFPGDHKTDGAGIIWQTWRPSSYSLKATKMKIKRN